MSFPVDRVWDAKAIEALAPDAASVPAAKKVLAKGGFTKIEPTADGRGWWCVCKGMTDTYQVSARLDAKGELASGCTCPSPKDPCKHALAFLLFLAAHPELRSTAKAARGTSGDFEGLLRAVFASPDDDTPRLVFADYLDETGESDRATFIRAQCELARDPSRPAVVKAAKAAMTKVNRLVGPVPEQFTLTFARGFVTVGTNYYGLGDVAGWPGRFAALFRDGWVERLLIRSSDPDPPDAILSVLLQVGTLDFARVRQSERELATLAAELRDRKTGSRLTTVRVHPRDEAFFQTQLTGKQADDDPPQGPPGYDNTGPARHYIGLTERQVEQLARHDRLREVRFLNLEKCPGDTVAHLVGYGELPRLTLLFVRNGGIGSAGMAAVARGEFRRLEDLAVLRQDGAGLVAALATGSPGVTRLMLSECKLTDADAAALAGGPEWPRLQAFDVSDNRLSAAGVRALLDTRRWPSLQSLTTRGNPAPVGDLFAGLVALPSGRAFTLEHGTTTMNRQPGKGRDGLKMSVQGSGSAKGLFARLTGCRRADQITHLTTAGVALGAANVADLFTAVSGGRLWYLALRSAKLGDPGATAVADGLERAEVEYLDLSHNRIGVPGMTALAGSRGLRSVVTLFLSGSQTPVSGLEALADSPHRGRLEEVQCIGMRLTDSRRKELRARFGKGVKVSV